MAVVYGLFTDQLCWYVGSTTNLNDRERKHRRRVKPGIGADLIPSEYDWECRKLEDCDVENRYVRERHWYEDLKPLLNKCVPGRSRKERDAAWYAANRERHNERVRQYRAANWERHKERMRQWYAAKRAAAATAEAAQVLR